MRVKLSHRSNFPGSEGGPGQEVTVNDELGQRWIDTRGAERIDEPEPAKPAEPFRVSEPVVETAAKTPQPKKRPVRKKAAKRRSE